MPGEGRRHRVQADVGAHIDILEAAAGERADDAGNRRLVFAGEYDLVRYRAAGTNPDFALEQRHFVKPLPS